MEEREAPYDWVEIAPLFENFKALVIELFIFKLPQNESEVKDVAVKDILGEKIIENNFIGPISKDVIKSFDAVGWCSFSNNQFCLWICFGGNSQSFASVCRIQTICALLWEVEFSFESLGAIGWKAEIKDLSLLMALQRD